MEVSQIYKLNARATVGILRNKRQLIIFVTRQYRKIPHQKETRMKLLKEGREISAAIITILRTI